MKLLTIKDKHLMFGSAGKISTTNKSTKTPKYKKRQTKSPDMSGMLMAAGLGATDKLSTKKYSNKTVASKRETFYKEFNKYGMIALVGGALLNHSINSSYKLMAALDGDSEKYKYYEDKSKNYIKPHFSLPSQWHQPRITFGTPWYY